MKAPIPSILCTIVGVIRHFYLIFYLFLATSFSLAQSSSKELLTVNMLNADITAVIQWIAEQTNKKIIVDPRVKGKVTVLANEPMSSDQAYNIFLTMLDVYGFAATETGGILRIFPVSQAKSTPSKLINNFKSLGGSEHILYVFKAKNVSVTQLAQALKPLIASTGLMTPHSESNSLIIADESANVKRLVLMMRQIDVSGSIDMDVIKLKHASAKNVAGVVTSLINVKDAKAFSIVSDDRSNSILMSGNPSTRSQVKTLINQLDKPLSAGGNTRVVYLHYLDAVELVPILKGMSDSIQKDTKQVSAASASISIEASESANALVITAPPDMLNAMEQVIAQIDIRRAQVMLEAVIVEVNKDFTQSLGVEWNTSFSAENSTEAITNFGLRGINTNNGTVSFIGSGLSLGFYHHGSLRALLQTIATHTDANILSTPSILTLDNQEAEILVGSNVPFLTGQSQGTPGSSNGNNFEDPFTTIDRHDIGITLKITPKVNEGDSVTLDILQEIESITDSATVTSDIVTNKRSIKTKVLVADETILVLGGLISDETQKIVSKVPILGDLPIVGSLFRSTTDSKTKKNLMVFIHPTIMADDDVAKSYSNKKLNYMKNIKEKYSQGKFYSEKTELEEFEHFKPSKKQNQ